MSRLTKTSTTAGPGGAPVVAASASDVEAAGRAAATNPAEMTTTAANFPQGGVLRHHENNDDDDDPSNNSLPNRKKKLKIKQGDSSEGIPFVVEEGGDGDGDSIRSTKKDERRLQGDTCTREVAPCSPSPLCLSVEDLLSVPFEVIVQYSSPPAIIPTPSTLRDGTVTSPPRQGSKARQGWTSYTPSSSSMGGRTRATRRPLLSRAEAGHLLKVIMLAQDMDSLVERCGQALDVRRQCRASLRNLLLASGRSSETTRTTTTAAATSAQRRAFAPQLLPLATLLHAVGEHQPEQALGKLDGQLRGVEDELRQLSESIRASSEQNWTVSESLFADSDALRLGRGKDNDDDEGRGSRGKEDDDDDDKGTSGPGSRRRPATSAVEYLARAKRALSDVQDEVAERIDALLEQRLTGTRMLDVSMEQFSREMFDVLVVSAQHDGVDDDDGGDDTEGLTCGASPVAGTLKAGSSPLLTPRRGQASLKDDAATVDRSDELDRPAAEPEPIGLSGEDGGNDPRSVAPGGSEVRVSDAGTASAPSSALPPSSWVPFGQATPPTTRPSNPSTQQQATAPSSSPAVMMMEEEEEVPPEPKSPPPTNEELAAKPRRLDSASLGTKDDEPLPSLLDPEEKENSQQHQQLLLLPYGNRSAASRSSQPCVKDVMDMALSSPSLSGSGGPPRPAGSVYTASQEAEASHAVARVLAGMTTTTTATPAAAAAADITKATPARAAYDMLEDEE